ncbi:MAG: DUF1697 domain-containing protein [Alphaproteobacteria bacterium]|nr:DUF1697 domain-containing protein [Alphaproteobacteria bacterium]
MARKGYLVLLRGINVGGKNKIPMAALKLFLEEQGFSDVTTYIQSGNVVLRSELAAKAVAATIEDGLTKRFALDTAVINILVLTGKQLRATVDNRPKGFGDQPAKYRSDVLFLIDIKADDALKDFAPKEGVDNVWPSGPAIYAQRLSAKRTKSRLNRIMSTPAYKSMTIRNWSTTTKLLEMLEGLRS